MRTTLLKAVVTILKAVVTIGVVCAVAPACGTVRPEAADAVAVDADDVGGVVTSTKGPEAGVWVIAETTDLPTKFAKIVVTDDRGRYVLPDLPKANYTVLVRGYGLVDSPKVQTAPGSTLNLTAVIAPDAARRGAVLPRRLLGLAAARFRPRASSRAPARRGTASRRR